MCDFCKETNDGIISNSHITSTGREAFADLRFDADNCQLDIIFGLLEEDRSQGNDATWGDSLDIYFCPICGRKIT